MKVVAVDQGQPQKTATAYLVVHVLPRNYTGIAFIPPIIRLSVPSSKLLSCGRSCLRTWHRLVVLYTALSLIAFISRIIWLSVPSSKLLNCGGFCLPYLALTSCSVDSFVSRDQLHFL